MIADAWVKAIVETYPADSSGFLLKQKDSFANPVGSTIRSSARSLMDELSGDMDSLRTMQAVDDLMRIRAVQEFTPAQALGIIFDLKKIVRAEVRSLLMNSDAMHQLLEFESRVDLVALHAFDKHAENRERLFEIRADEARRSVAKLRERLTRLDPLESGPSDT
jgi:hypothetical protein